MRTRKCCVAAWLERLRAAVGSKRQTSWVQSPAATAAMGADRSDPASKRRGPSGPPGPLGGAHGERSCAVGEEEEEEKRHGTARHMWCVAQ